MSVLPRTVGPYDVVSVLGRGGMGVVLRARHRALGCTRAVKVLEETPDATRTARFLREATALARVRHPNVVAVHDVGQEGKLLFFAMDLVEGGRTLDVLMSEGLPLERGLAIVEQIARGLHAVHEGGLTHRDVKPSNVVVDASGGAFLIDFGVVTSAEAERLTKTNALVGTPAYFAPEYVLGLAREPGPTIDVYALGVVLYEIATGTLPIEAETPQQFFHALASGKTFRAPSTVRPGVPRDLDLICARALAREPSARYANALELADDLALLQKGKAPPHASSAEATAAIVRRRRIGRASKVLAAIGVGLAAAGLGRLAWQRAFEAENAARALEARLTDIERRLRRSGRTFDPIENERLALAVEGEARALGDPGKTLAARALELAGEAALQQHQLAIAGDRLAALESSHVLDASALAPLVAGIAALSTHATTDTARGAEALLTKALEAGERGDLLLWRALVRARLGDKAPARQDAARAQMLGFDARPESLIVLALAGDPETARRAIRDSGLSDPAFAHPFVARALALLAQRGNEREALRATQEALRYTTPGTPELRELSEAAHRKATLVAGEDVGRATLPWPELDALLQRIDPLLTIASAASPELRDPRLAARLRDAAYWVGNKNDDAHPGRKRLAELAIALDPEQFLDWHMLAIVLNGAEDREGALKAVERARAFARTPHDAGAVSIEECYALSHMNQPERVVEVANDAIKALGPDLPPDDNTVRERLYGFLTSALCQLRRYQDCVVACTKAERLGIVLAIRSARAEARENTGDVEGALEDWLACVTPGTTSDSDIYRCVKSLEGVVRKLGRPLSVAEDGYARALGVVTGDDARRIGERRAALALERNDAPGALRFLKAALRDAATDFRTPIEHAIAALAAGEAPPDLAERLRIAAENH